MMLRDHLVRRAIERLRERSLPLAVNFGDGRAYAPAGEAVVTLHLRRPEALQSMVAPTLGRLARAYVEQHFDIDGDLREVIRLGEQMCDAATAIDRKGSSALSWLRHTRPGDRRNIGFHYDVSNEFFALWLDAQRVYSCAYFGAEDDSLERAQERKLDLICRKLMLVPGERLLDIGCGWGALIVHAATHYGVRATGITLSREQHEFARAEIERRGLAGRVEVRLQDYREVPEDAPFDKIASVGMFEHVGRSNLGGYFAKIGRLLAPGGLVLNHGITAAAPDTSGLRSDIDDFIERYVFPGGELVHVSRVIESLSQQGLETLDVESLRPHYARTLWHWVDRLEAQAARAREIVGERKFRVWRIYMAGSAHAFARGWISIFQILAGKPRALGEMPYPFRRDHLYR
jgi:cyclopropane-fatty-acyl-phospholipid synthase